MQQKQIYCEECEKITVGEKESTNHVLHLLLTIITSGLWLIVWFLHIWLDYLTKYECLECGNNERKKK